MTGAGRHFRREPSNELSFQIKRTKSYPAVLKEFAVFPVSNFSPHYVNPISPGRFGTVNAWGGGGFHPPCLSMLLLEIWQPNLAQRFSII